MRPLIELSNQERAKYLHEFLPHDMKAIISFIEHISHFILKNQREIRNEWESKTIAVGQWFNLAEEANNKISEHRPRLIADSQFFADELFAAYMGIFSLHCIQEFVEISHNQRLLDGVKFFFDLKPRKKLPGDEIE